MNRQVVTVSPAGEISGLQRKPGQGIDLRQFGHAEIERASEIVWSPDVQRWEVAILTGPYEGQRLTGMLWVEAGLAYSQPVPSGGEYGRSPADPIRFVDYDFAVTAEIAFLDAVRLKGLF